MNTSRCERASAGSTDLPPLIVVRSRYSDSQRQRFKRFTTFRRKGVETCDDKFLLRIVESSHDLSSFENT